MRAADEEVRRHEHEADRGADRAVDAGEDRPEDDRHRRHDEGAPREIAGDLAFVCGDVY